MVFFPWAWTSFPVEPENGIPGSVIRGRIGRIWDTLFWGNMGGDSCIPTLVLRRKGGQDREDSAIFRGRNRKKKVIQANRHPVRTLIRCIMRIYMMKKIGRTGILLGIAGFIVAIVLSWLSFLIFISGIILIGAGLICLQFDPPEWYELRGR